MTYAAKVDTNQPEIVASLREAGASVQHLHMVGHGCPDILVCFRGVLFLMEIKYGHGKLTIDEQIWHAAWCGSVAIVRSVDDALIAIGAVEALNE